MKLGRITVSMLLIGILMGVPAPTRAEEITLKDGQKIVGTIVGYEKDMFRVETAYGVALVRKDKITSIQVAKPDAANPQPAPRSATKTIDVKPARISAAPEVAPAPIPPAPAPPKPPAPPVPPKPKSPPPPPPPPPVSHPIDVPMPAHLQEHVDGNTYFSDSFQFSMFKPPDWKAFEGVSKETGSGITAMGTDDEQTLLVVDRQVWSGTPSLASDSIEAKLRQTYQEYHRISEQPVTCDGQPAIRRTFTGIVDGAEWHGVAVHVIHGNTVFGIIGLTSAETFQFQEAIFNKIIRTFHFLSPAAPGAALPAGNP
ncbi:MAG: hypothetical protein P4N24_13575 [Acidobacteriota bacterium]|nr:hypothetical protein [Acidobacteriota bacterium]